MRWLEQENGELEIQRKEKNGTLNSCRNQTELQKIEEGQPSGIINTKNKSEKETKSNVITFIKYQNCGGRQTELKFLKCKNDGEKKTSLIATDTYGRTAEALMESWFISMLPLEEKRDFWAQSQRRQHIKFPVF